MFLNNSPEQRLLQIYFKNRSYGIVCNFEFQLIFLKFCVLGTAPIRVLARTDCEILIEGSYQGVGILLTNSSYKDIHEIFLFRFRICVESTDKFYGSVTQVQNIFFPKHIKIKMQGWLDK